MASDSLHEPYDLLSDDTKDLHRAIRSLMEEFEAVDWYQQRADVTTDDRLRAILTHNRDEEIEHAVMVLEWLRRKLPKLDEELRRVLFSEGEITAHEAKATEAAALAGGSRATVGSLRRRAD